MELYAYAFYLLLGFNIGTVVAYFVIKGILFQPVVKFVPEVSYAKDEIKSQLSSSPIPAGTILPKKF
jgi:hypothetical protein